MASFHDITTAQLRRMLYLKERIEFLQETLHRLRGDAPTHPKRKVGCPAGKRTMSAATIEKMRAAQQARRAKMNEKASTKASPKVKSTTVQAPVSKKSTPAKAAPKKKVMSPEAKAKIAAAMKARWEAKKKDAAAK